VHLLIETKARGALQMTYFKQLEQFSKTLASAVVSIFEDFGFSDFLSKFRHIRRPGRGSEWT